MTKDLADQIDEIVRQRSLLAHPFYQAWNAGTLTMASLREYARQYYHFEKAYPTFLSGLHYRCSDQRIRQLILENLWDEEHGAENHVELWLRFCDALGLDREEVRESEPSEATAALVETYQRLTSRGPLAAGASALYAYESQVPEVARSKIDGLKRFYDIDSDGAVEFFTLHEKLDREHSDAERQMVMALCETPDDGSAALDAAQTATASLWAFLDGVGD